MARLGSAVLLCAYFFGGSKSGAGKRSGQNPLRASFGCCRLNEAWKSAIRSSIDLGLGHGELTLSTCPLSQVRLRGTSLAQGPCALRARVAFWGALFLVLLASFRAFHFETHTLGCGTFAEPKLERTAARRGLFLPLEKDQALLKVYIALKKGDPLCSQELETSSDWFWTMLNLRSMSH